MASPAWFGHDAGNDGVPVVLHGLRPAVHRHLRIQIPLGQATNQIRWIIAANLALGIAAVVIGATGRYWA